MLGATNPLLRYLADAAPQRGELAMRGGQAVSNFMSKTMSNCCRGVDGHLGVRDWVPGSSGNSMGTQRGLSLAGAGACCHPCVWLGSVEEGGCSQLSCGVWDRMPGGGRAPSLGGSLPSS